MGRLDSAACKALPYFFLNGTIPFLHFIYFAFYIYIKTQHTDTKMDVPESSLHASAYIVPYLQGK